MKIAVVGGGPAGLYFALLTKKRDPGHDIRVYEQSPQDATYGWGVVFSEAGLAELKAADASFHNEFTAHHVQCDYMEVVHRGAHVQIHGNHFSRTSRIEMLHVLQRACERVGIEVEYGHRVDDARALARDVDLLVAADGSNSVVRRQFAEHFRPSFEKRRNKFAWYGTRQRFHAVSLIFREAECGVFIAHSYQYNRELSTFLVEVDPETWHRAGLDKADEDESRRLCTGVFRAELGANELLTNRSLWFEANIVRNERWTHENVVLIGDALRTVHFSLGSGTRMAMQDAVVLHNSLIQTGDEVAAAFHQFESVRRSASASFQAAAGRSLDWYESVGGKMHLDPISFAYDYMRRTGQVSHDDLVKRDPYFAAAADKQLQEPSNQKDAGSSTFTNPGATTR
jgi:2-polyprenyl-6-methoxyphenol hydroxylase-like FAD-dependent oxidoreductase